ncbi:hypothetical protein RRG08_016477 [Elysia crispata]|uniref:Uncharacterized protein n=1 Tax=Elysia crispata TaxID=231223 RepID=A0AAE0Y8V5_9GAST|nr:hypothetical protein RRG08_016477 [Elysia crispata]
MDKDQVSCNGSTPLNSRAAPDVTSGRLPACGELLAISQRDFGICKRWPQLTREEGHRNPGWTWSMTFWKTGVHKTVTARHWTPRGVSRQRSAPGQSRH